MKVPFPGVRWNKEGGKVLLRNEAWDALPNAVRTEALRMPAWDFLHAADKIWAKYVVEDDGETETFFLLPAEAYYDVVQRLEKAQVEAKHLREQLHAFVQNIPLPIFVVDTSQTDQITRITFANKLLLDMARIPLRRLYEGLSLQDIFKEAAPNAQNLIKSAREAQQPAQEVIELPEQEGAIYWLTRAFPFKSPSLEGVMVGIVDLTREKEQEKYLIEAFQELQVQAEELRQSQEELASVNEALGVALQEADTRLRELEESLKAAQRYQRTILFRTKNLYEAWGYERISVVARPCAYVGGDFIISRRVGEWLYAGIGDATGHGSSGALLAVTIQSIIHQYLFQLPSPIHLHEALEAARQELADIWEIQLGTQLSNEGAEIALVALPLSDDKKAMYVATAGRPIYILASDGTLRELMQGRRGIGWSIPGQSPEPYTTQELPYPQGSTLFLFTDGITDQLGLSGKRLGRKTFLSWLPECASSAGDPRAQTRYLLQRWQSWKTDSVEQTDDLLLLAFAL
ncbi:MAG: SpoIIE family protein phosphatase [Bacteroidia bacterium]|nr:SpoIIE family protein phosphatase [Bacteroidia bacterium]